MPQPSAMTRSASSLFSSTLASATDSVFSTLPRSGRTACRSRSRPCFAEPPAESPSTMKSSVSSRSLLEQSLSLPGSVSRPLVAVLRDTAADAARDASRARAARTMRATICSATVRFELSHCSSAGPHGVVDVVLHLGVVQAVLGLTLELRLRDEDAEHADEALRGCPPPVSVTPRGASSCVSM